MMNNNKNEVLIVLTERWNDWEASYAIAVINSFSDYEDFIDFTHDEVLELLTPTRNLISRINQILKK